jgi:hypothetical protein
MAYNADSFYSQSALRSERVTQPTSHNTPPPPPLPPFN